MTREEKTEFRDKIKVYRLHNRQMQHRWLKVDEYLNVRGKDKFWIFP